MRRANGCAGKEEEEEKEKLFSTILYSTPVLRPRVVSSYATGINQSINDRAAKHGHITSTFLFFDEGVFHSACLAIRNVLFRIHGRRAIDIYSGSLDHLSAGLDLVSL